ncbi:MAG: hypothetical protein HY244_12650 [Rhizobiales bacterium]|nr:hypothetical protein [Hyphomicrobiales bacterium]
MPDVARDAVGGLAHDVIVFAEHHMGTVLLDPPGRHDSHGVAVIDGAAHLDPRHVGHFDGIGYRRGQGILRKHHRQAGDDECAERNRSPRELACGRLAVDRFGRLVGIHGAVLCLA